MLQFMGYQIHDGRAIIMAVYTAIDFGGGTAPSWTAVTSNIIMVPNSRYYVNINSILTLPILSNVGDTLRIVNFEASQFTIGQNFGQDIIGLGSVITTNGTGGFIVAAQDGAEIEMVCLVANTTWQIVGENGSIQFN